MKKLSIVMPAYNEEALIYDSLLKTVSIIERFHDNFEILAVNDGSKDNTKAQIMKASKEDARIKLVSYEINRGKGGAIIAGVMEADGDYIAFLDADLELPPAQLEGYIAKLEQSGSDVVIGCKYHKDSHIKYPFKRRIISLGYYMMLVVLFHLNVKDTQTGIKLFKAEPIKAVAPLVKTKGFAYDIELLVAINRRGYRIEEMPVQLEFVREKGSRRIGLKDIVKVFADTWKIFVRLYFKKYYDR